MNTGLTRRMGLWALLGLFVASGLAEEKLPGDPRVLTGKLDNGVRWMYRRHANPPGKMALMMHIATGSLNEKDSQRGLAHFIEHMAFNGSENFAPGELIPYFESIGMEFGGDINAFTSFDQTAYMIFLPDTTTGQIDKALMVLSDQAFRLLLLEEEIDKERGVILAEKRAGLSAEQRIRDKLWPQVFAGSRFAQRMPIGLEEVIEKAPREEFVDYFRTWYRPEAVTVMLVGDADPEPIIPLIEKWFGKYRAEAPARPAASPEFKLFTEQRGIVVTDPEYARCRISMYKLLPGRPATTTVAHARRDLIESIATWIIGRRFEERIKKGEASFIDAGAGVQNFFHDAVLVAAECSGEPEKWEKMLAELVEEVARARQYGFTEREFELAKRDLLAEARRAVKTEETRNARGLLFEMNSAVNNGEPLLSAQQQLDLLEKLLPGIELAEVSASFAESFAPGAFAYVVTMPEKKDVAVPDQQQVLAAARAALARKVSPPEGAGEIAKLLEAEPQPGSVVEHGSDAELEVNHYWLSNGLRVHQRYMDYKKDYIHVAIALAGGRIEETRANAGITEVASLVFNQPATGRLDSSAITDVMTGRNITLSPQLTGDALVLHLRGSPEDLEIGLRLVHALLTDGRIEQSAFDNWKQRTIQRLKMYEKFPQFAAVRRFRELISGDDPRLTSMTIERVEAQSLSAAQAWLERLARQAPIEVAVVGEMSAEQVMPLVLRYLGSLPPRPRSAAYLDPLRTVKRPAGPLSAEVEVKTITPQAMVIAGFVGCEATAYDDVRALELASKTLDSRLIKRIREELSLVYSIGVHNAPANVYRDAGVFLSGAPCAPNTPEQVIAELSAIFADFAQQGPSEQELANARKQVLNHLDTQVKEPDYWVNVLVGLDLHGVDLAQVKRHHEAYENFTREKVREVFAHYYVPERTFQVIAVPVNDEDEPAGPAGEQAEPEKVGGPHKQGG